MYTVWGFTRLAACTIRVVVLLYATGFLRLTFVGGVYDSTKFPCIILEPYVYSFFTRLAVCKNRVVDLLCGPGFLRLSFFGGVYASNKFPGRILALCIQFFYTIGGMYNSTS